ncbi:MAG: type III secretion inner membrane ring lipoprotein SctJ [Puniceicoccales bacterium]|jgi:type III secretion protein J|nr:type III secretion inner membrane ring lipoprotein SctJ [Puniceicoccales bacterium]
MEKSGFFKRLRALFNAVVALLLVGCGQVELLSNLPEREANEIVSIMQQYGIPVAKKAGLELAWTVVLKNSDNFNRATSILNTLGYPKVQFETMGRVFQKSGLVSSPLEERARFMYALSENIADTLNHIPGVLTSRVHIVLPENDPYSDADIEASAAIFLTYKSGGNLDEFAREIKYLVANSVQGLDYDKVSIAMFPVTFDTVVSQDAMTDNNVSVLGLRMASDAASKFLIMVIGLSGIALCFAASAAFFFMELRKTRKGTRPVAAQQAVPVVVQNDEGDASALDEIAPEAAQPPEKEK